jgi:DUF1680 family protein
MKEFRIPDIAIDDPFWNKRLKMNAEQAIFFQWQMLEDTGTINNFRIAAKQKEGFRYGFFYSDSDATKWLDAANRILISTPNNKLKDIVDEFIRILSKAQCEDGYLFTYNQLLFPKVRWKNIQVEHELYCHGHLIEGAPYHLIATGDSSLVDIAKKAAKLIDSEFNGVQSNKKRIAPGHQEIEIALIKLYRCTGDMKYLDLAEHFLMQRGHLSFFGFRFFKQMLSTVFRMRKVEHLKKKYLKEHPQEQPIRLPDHVKMDMPRAILLRSLYGFLSGKYNQQHKPVLKQTVPEGHAVRFAYQQTALSMLCRERPDPKLLSVLKMSWDHMVQKRMYVSGGIGSIPLVEGFGYDYELDPKYAYCETCAAIGSLLWNWEMILLTQESKYADLFEWQLYNAASVGISNKGDSYLYRNPLASEGKLKREKWFATPCCPSNISRLWASLGQFIFSFTDEAVYIHQYISSKIKNSDNNAPLVVELSSEFPYSGKVGILITEVSEANKKLMIRIPSWTDSYTIHINGEQYTTEVDKSQSSGSLSIESASGYNPYHSYYLPIHPARPEGWRKGDLIKIEFGMPVRILKPHKKVKAVKNMVAISRGPLLYCIEEVDNPDITLGKIRIDVNTIKVAEKANNGVEAICLDCLTQEGKPLTLIPYYLWGNRSPGRMSVYLAIK